MKTKIKVSIFALILPVIICLLTLETGAAKLNPKPPDIIKTLKRQTYSDATLRGKDFYTPDPYASKNVLTESSDPQKNIPIYHNKGNFAGILNRSSQLYTSYSCEFRNNNYSNYTTIYDAFKEVLEGRSTLHGKLLKAEASKLTIGFLKANDGFEAFVIFKSPKDEIRIAPGYDSVHTPKQTIDSFFAREDVKKEILNSSLDLPNTKVMLLYSFSLYRDIEVMFYDENSEFIMFMEDKKCEALEPWGHPGEHVVEKAGKVYSAATLYPVSEVLGDLIYLSDEYTRKYGVVNAIMQGEIDYTMKPPDWVPW